MARGLESRARSWARACCTAGNSLDLDILALVQTEQHEWLRPNASSGTPIFQQIAQTVRDRVARGALRPGEALPTVRELARALGVNQNTVIRAYGLLRAEGLIEGRNSQGTRVAESVTSERRRAVREAELRLHVARFIGEMAGHGYALGEIDAAFFGQRERAPEDSAGRGTSVSYLGLGSHDVSLDLLLSYCQRLRPERRVLFGAVGSTAGLGALARGEADFAASHLFDPEADDYNAPFVRRLRPRLRATLITLAQRTTGWAVAPGNPKGIRAARDLARRGVRLVNRQAGAGTRVLLDAMLRRARVPRARLDGYAREEKTHMALARAVADGSADVGICIEASARAYGLDFVPITVERFELVLPRDHALVGVFGEVLAREDFRSAVTALGGYDVAEMGRARHV